VANDSIEGKGFLVSPMPTEPTKLRRWSPRFSLLTLLLTVLLIGSSGTLWLHWDAWYCVKVLEGHASTVYSGEFSPDGTRILTFTAGSDNSFFNNSQPIEERTNVTRLWDASTFEPFSPRPRCSGGEGSGVRGVRVSRRR